MPQDEESSAELRYLAAVPRQMISPAKNQSLLAFSKTLCCLLKNYSCKLELQHMKQ